MRTWWLPLLLIPISIAELAQVMLHVRGAEEILAFASRGIHLYVTVILSCYAAYVLKCEGNKSVRLIAWIVTALCLSGAIGFVANRQPPAMPVDLMDPIQAHDSRVDQECTQSRFIDVVRCVRQVQRRPLPPFFTLTDTDAFEAGIQFERFPPEFERYVDRAARGEIRLLVESFAVFQYTDAYEVTVPGVSTSARSTEPLKYELTREQVTAFLKAKTVVFKTLLPAGKVLAINSRNLQIRNAAYRLEYRRDWARFNGLPFSFPRGDTFLVTFCFETLDHIPLAVFF
jgi:hypothetical protein